MIDHDNIVLFLFFFIVILEGIYPRSKYKQKIVTEDYLWILVNNFLTASFVAATVTFLLSMSGEVITAIGIRRFDITSQNILIQFFIYFLCFTLFNYFQHYLFHRVPILWKFHQPHHSSTQLTVSASYRDHFLSLIIIDFVALSSTSFWIFSSNVSLISNTILMIWVLLLHSNLKLKSKYVSYFLLTPHDHLWHHAKDCKIRYGQNFGAFLSIWDRLFKTYYYSDEIPEVGIHGYNEKGILNKLLKPFKK